MAALVIAVGAGVAVSGNADAAPRGVLARAAPTAITAVSVSSVAVTVHGLDLATVVVSVTLKSESGDDPDTVTLERTSKTWDLAAPGYLSARLVRTSGTTGNGTYQGKVAVPSSAHGTWRVGFISFGTDINGTSVDPRDSGVRDATLKVTGTHRPRIRVTFSPRPLPYPQRVLTMSARLSYDDTRKPIVGRWVFFCWGVPDCELGRSGQARTDRRGIVSRHVTVVENDDLLGAAWMPFPLRSALTDSNQSYAVDGGLSPLIGSRTTAAPSKTSVRRGTTVGVNGHAFAVIGAAGNRVVLKRLVAGHWRTVSAARVRSSGRFTLHASPPKGRNSYRVALSGSGHLLGSRSRVFIITGR